MLFFLMFETIRFVMRSLFGFHPYPRLLVAEVAGVLLQKAKSLFHADALAISSSSSDPLKAKNTIQYVLHHLKNGPLYGASQVFLQKVIPPTSAQTTPNLDLCINLSCPFLADHYPSTFSSFWPNHLLRLSCPLSTPPAQNCSLISKHYVRLASKVITVSGLQSFYPSRPFFCFTAWFPFLSDALKKHLKSFYRSACKADWSFLLYFSILLLESLLSRLEITLCSPSLSKPFASRLTASPWIQSCHTEETGYLSVPCMNPIPSVPDNSRCCAPHS